MSGLFFLCQVHGYFEKSSTKHPLAYTLTTAGLLKWWNGGRNRLKIQLLFPTELRSDRPVTMKYVLCAHKNCTLLLETNCGAPPH